MSSTEQNLIASSSTLFVVCSHLRIICLDGKPRRKEGKDEEERNFACIIDEDLRERERGEQNIATVHVPTYRTGT